MKTKNTISDFLNSVSKAKKSVIIIIMVLACLTSRFKANGQSTCSTAVLQPKDSLLTITMNDSVYWLRFTADTTQYNIYIVPVPNEQEHIQSMKLYGGNCASLQGLFTCTYSDSLDFYYYNFSISSTYYLKISKGSRNQKVINLKIRTKHPGPSWNNLDCPHPVCDLISNGNFNTYHFVSNPTNYNWQNYFIDNRVCAWHAGIGCPQLVPHEFFPNDPFAAYAIISSVYDAQIGMTRGKMIFQHIPIIAGQNYTIRFNYRVWNSTINHFMIGIEDHDYMTQINLCYSPLDPAELPGEGHHIDELDNLPFDQNWHFYEHQFQAQNNGDRIVFYIIQDPGSAFASIHLDNVQLIPLITVDAGPDRNICSPGSVQIGNPAVSNYNPAYAWAPTAGLDYSDIAQPVASPTVTTIYTVVATDTIGCQANDNVVVNVNIDPVINGNRNTCDSILSTYFLTNFVPGQTYTWSLIPAAAGTITPVNGTTVNVTWNMANFPALPDSAYITVTGCNSTVRYTIWKCCTKLNTQMYHDVTFPSGTNLQGGVILNGDIFISGNVTFSNTSMGPDARVFLNPNSNLNITNATLQSQCNYMWNGIYVDASCTITANTSTIKDAKNAIVSSNGGTVNLINTLFDKNIRHLVFQNCTLTTNPAMISKSQFTCSGTLIPPRVGHRTKIGIDVYYVNKLFIGDSSSFINRNTFSHMNKCINIMASNVRVLNNKFDYADSANCYGIYSSNYGFNPTNTITVGAMNALPLIRSNFINNYPYGIYINTNQNINIYCDTIKSSLIDISVMNCTGKTIKIKRNLMSYPSSFKWLGVCMNDISNSTVFIDTNTITDAAVYGIAVQNAQMNPVTRLQICANYITTKANAFLPNSEGINVTNISGYNMNQSYAYISHNNVTMNYNTSTTQFRGISSVSSNCTRMQKNTVMPVSTYPTYTSTTAPNFVGLYGEGGNTYTFCRNTAYRMGSGIKCNVITGSNSALKLNLLDNTYYGIKIDNAYIGNQYTLPSTAFDNRWVSTTTAIQGSLPIVLGWYYQGPQSSGNPFCPYTYSFTPSNNLRLYPNKSACPDCLVAAFTGTKLFSEGGALPVVENSDSTDTPRGRARKYLSDYYTYFSLKELLRNRQSCLDNNEALSSFYSVLDEGSIGEIGRVNDEIKNGNYENAKRHNNNVNRSYHFDKYLAEVNDIYLETWAKGRYDYTDDEYRNLKQIADADPINKGPAVYNARVMLMTVPAMTQRSLEDINSPGDKPENNEGNIKAGSLYPNPANNEASLDYDMGSASMGILYLYDITGKLVLKEQLLANKNKVTISTGSLNHGVYLYNVTMDNAVIKTGKLVIIK